FDLTTDKTIDPVRDRSTTAALDPRDVDAMKKMLADGYGDFVDGAAWPVVDTTFDGSPPPTPGPNPKLLTRFMHLADTQLADDESPARLAVFDSTQITSGAFRPQEGHECRILNAAVRTINVIHKKMPLEFVLLGGDNADNAQSNELD